ncbi:MAG TPA: peptidylprolyl isomerase [Dongiaceae bacterium]|nr:peptidylprolyl isomerase [Dongiaceae bacterium]
MYRPILFALAVLAGFCALAPGLRAQDSLQIVAVVNDDPISKIDLIVRMQLVMRSTGLKDSPDVRARLAPQVLRSLIDERIKRAEAKAQGITANQAEVEQALAQLAQQNGMTIDQFNAAVRQDPLVAQAFTDQATATIAWNKLISAKLGPEVNVTQQDIDDEMRRVSESLGKPEYQLGEIFLAVDQPDQDAAVRQSADRLMDQLRQGADFERLAAQFSQSRSASSGGLVGWVRPDQLDQELSDAVTNMKPGQYDGPIRSAGGYYIVQVRRIRPIGKADPDDTVVALKQIFVSAPSTLPKAQIDAALSKVQALRARISNCADMDKVGGEVMPAGSIDLGSATIADLPDELKDMGRNLPIGQISAPVQVDTGIGIFMVCKRQPAEDKKPSRAAVARSLIAARVDDLARGYLRDLRRAAVIDIRNATL